MNIQILDETWLQFLHVFGLPLTTCSRKGVVEAPEIPSWYIPDNQQYVCNRWRPEDNSFNSLHSQHTFSTFSSYLSMDDCGVFDAPSNVWSGEHFVYANS